AGVDAGGNGDGPVTWRLRISHRTGFHYSSDVVSSYNEARLMPLSTPEQLVIDAEVSIDPIVPAYRYWDYWGTLVHAFDIHVAHTELVVTATSLVETAGPRDPAQAPAAGNWDALAVSDGPQEFAELLTSTDYAPLVDEIRLAGEALAQGRSPVETCEAVGAWVRDNLRYEQGSTTVTTTAVDALRQRSGVCQDFAHLSLALLRAAGIPARYVSGYLYPSEDELVGTTVTGQSHAWIEAWLGEWMPFDPTNGQPVGERHVVVGRARDYADVTPLKGIYHGGPSSALAVSVDLTRLA
ncbi:MAG TPA: transglutaminase family protein, partial [Acidimicrobiales bacterium]